MIRRPRWRMRWPGTSTPPQAARRTPWTVAIYFYLERHADRVTTSLTRCVATSQMSASTHRADTTSPRGTAVAVARLCSAQVIYAGADSDDEERRRGWLGIWPCRVRRT